MGEAFRITHLFEGDGKYCTRPIDPRLVRSAKCGYPRDMHPVVCTATPNCVKPEGHDKGCLSTENPITEDELPTTPPDHIVPQDVGPVWCPQMLAEHPIHTRHTWFNPEIGAVQCPGLYVTQPCQQTIKHDQHYWVPIDDMVSDGCWCPGLNNPGQLRIAHCGQNDVHYEHRITEHAACLGVGPDGKGLLVQMHDGIQRLTPWPKRPHLFDKGALGKFKPYDWQRPIRTKGPVEIEKPGTGPMPLLFDDSYWARMKDVIREVLAEQRGIR